MSNKHLACLFLFGIIVGCVQLALVMNKKMTVAREAQTDAEAMLKVATDSRKIKETQLLSLKHDKASLRQYLALWLPKLMETNEETKARALFARIQKQYGEGLVAHADRSNVIPNKDSTFIPQRYQNILAVEGDYAQAVALIGQIERQMPASRISTVSIAKGTRGNDVKLSLTVETPLLGKADASAPGAAKKK